MPFALIGFTLGYRDKFILNDGLLPLKWSYSLPFGLQGNIWTILVLVILCMVFARSAAMAFNRYIDERFDKLNPRTAVREIPSGIIARQHALWFVLINCVLFAASAYFINTLCLYLTPIALFVILFYSYTKRFTPLCHLVLGVGLSLAPIGAYLAVTGEFHVLPLLFSATVFTWVSAFDILYALQDEDFDRSNGLNSIPVLLGRKNALLASRLLHTITAILVVSIGFSGLGSVLFWIGALAFIGLLIYQHTLVKVDDISKVNLAFGTTNGIASVIYAVFVIFSLLSCN